jgi:wyosine [tRNA(Phe)-imidazoG37] synthetase (radical SAM superfamily)
MSILIKIDHIQRFPKKNLRNKICWQPFKSVEIGLSGAVSMCPCANWMPTTIGNIHDNSLYDLLSSDLAKSIRRSILDGSYEFCNEQTCGVLQNDQLADLHTIEDKSTLYDDNHLLWPSEITVGIDSVCNLSCPSCRTGVIKPLPEEKDAFKAVAQHLSKQIFSKSSAQPMHLRISTSGEVFASPMLMEFLANISTNDFPNLKLILQTNGLLIPKNWSRLGDLQHRVKDVTVTIDAANSATYEKLRRGGLWTELLTAMDWLKTHKNIFGYSLTTRMVVQVDNYREIPDFYHFSKHYDVDLVEYARIANWGTFTPEQFKQIDVLDPSHEYHRHASELQNQIQKLSDVFVYG